MKWRLAIAKSIAKNNTKITDHDINSAVNHLLNRLLFLRVIDERKIENYDPLDEAVRKWKREELGPLFAYLIDVFKRLDPKYNGAIFSKHEVDNMLIDDKPLYDCIRNLYYPRTPYQFSEMPIEVIGNAYEQYLGSVLRLTPTRHVKLEEKPEVRKAGGVYYTPKYIVDYIVEQTIGKLVEGKTPAQVSKLRILDPACGSGSFLIGAFERLQKYYIDYYTANPKKNKGYLRKDYDGNLKLDVLLKGKILEENIYGVDIDPQAVDITEFSLYVKMFEGEANLPMLAGTYLPDLRKNVKCGNSLIGTDIMDMDILPPIGEERDAELTRINPFDWEENFPEIFRNTTRDNQVTRNPRLQSWAGDRRLKSSVAGDSESTAPRNSGLQSAADQSAGLEAHHITWVTHNSRVSERMVEVKAKHGKPVIMDQETQSVVVDAIIEKAEEMNIPIMAMNILSDHVHILLACREDGLEKIVQGLKGYSSYQVGRRLKSSVADGGRQQTLWAKHFSDTHIRGDEHLRNAIGYITNNHLKHDEPRNPRLQSWVGDRRLKSSVAGDVAGGDHEHTGGFDAVIGNPPYVRQEGLGEQKKYFAKIFESYAGSADLYTYFIERALKLLNESGRFSYIVSNKWMRSNYGKALRAFLKEYNIEEIIDFGELPVFADAATFPMIMVIRADGAQSSPDTDTATPRNGGLQSAAEQSAAEQSAAEQSTARRTLYAPIKRLDFDSLAKEKEHVAYSLEETAMDVKGYTLVRPETQAILDKMKETGVPLGEYVEGKIYRGVLTGFNEAFIIDKAKRDELIAEDPKSAEIIKPFVVGDDVRKYRINFRDRYLILTKIGVDIKRYPAIFKHLSQYKVRLEKRWDKGKYWWELRTCKYYDEFEKPKIIWPDIAKESRFAFDEGDYHIEATVFLLPNKNKYLLGLLNSSLIWFWLSNSCPVLGDQNKGGRLRLKTVYTINLPIRTIDFDNPDDVAAHDRMVSLVTDMLALNKRLQKTESPSTRKAIEAQIAHTDSTIDKLVYDLYNLTDKEIAIVEGGK